MQELNQSIGIDKTILKEFTLDSIDMKKLQEAQKDAGNMGASAELVTIHTGQPTLINGNEICSIRISDNRFGEFKIKKTQDFKTGREKIHSEMKLKVSNSKNNLRSLSANEYKTRVRAMLEHFKETYGLVINTEHMRISSLELNCTFPLAEPYPLYRDAIMLLMANAQSDGKIATWSSIRDGQLQLETSVIKNQGHELKIYDKTAHLADLRVMLDSEQSVMRIEFRFSDTRYMRIHTEAEFTDENLSTIFSKFFRKDVLLPYQQWRAKYQRELKRLLVHHMSTTRYWQDNFLRDIRQRNKLNACPALFDLEDVRAIIYELHTKDKNKSRRFNTFVSYCKYEHDLMGNSRRLDEILSQVAYLTTPQMSEVV